MCGATLLYVVSAATQTAVEKLVRRLRFTAKKLRKSVGIRLPSEPLPRAAPLIDASIDPVARNITDHASQRRNKHLNVHKNTKGHNSPVGGDNTQHAGGGVAGVANLSTKSHAPLSVSPVQDCSPPEPLA